MPMEDTYGIQSRIGSIIVVERWYCCRGSPVFSDRNIHASNNYPLSQGLTLSKEAGTLPTSFDAFRRKVLSADWEVVLCIAGTDKSDIRRVVFLYHRDEKSFIVNFPNGGKLTENETAIKSWIDSRLK